MTSYPAFHTDTALAAGLAKLFKQLEHRLELSQPVNAYLAGGMAVHLYTGNRVTADVDAEFSERIIIPTDLVVEVTQAAGRHKLLHFDTNYNATFALIHDSYIADSIPIDLGLSKICLHVLSPVDLATSKVGQFSASDKDDIAALVQHGLTTADEIEQRALSAMNCFVGDVSQFHLKLSDALVLIRAAERI